MEKTNPGSVPVAVVALDEFRRVAERRRSAAALQALRRLHRRLRHVAREIAYLAEIGTVVQFRASDET